MHTGLYTSSAHVSAGEDEKYGCTGVSEGKMLHMDKRRGWAVHNT